VGKVKKLKWGLLAGLLVAMAFIGGCAPVEGGEEGGGTSWTLIIFLILIFAVFYFLMIRPQRKKQKEHQQLMDELRRGDRVITAGGIYGQIESVSDESIVIKTEDGATLRIARSSIAGKRATK